MGCSRGSQRIVEVLGQTDLLLEMAEINATFRYAKKKFQTYSIFGFMQA